MRWIQNVRPGVAAWVAACVCLLLAAPFALSGCSVNPATGQQSFTAFMSPDEERRIGAEEHPKLVEVFGGLYDDAALQSYVDSIGRLLQQTSEQPEPPFRFVVLDSPIVNAFALPGGYVHVSRGLMALANDEAEFAGVVAHEIGHVTARHSAERYSRGVLAGLGAAVVGVATGSQAAGGLAQAAAGAYVQGYSRGQEFEADQLGVRYLTRSSYDPEAMSTFLASMGAQDRLARKIAGREGTDPAASLFSSHPRTADRVARAAESARAAAGGGLSRDREIYLRRIDGMIYGDSPKQGFVRGREFDHPVLRIRFTAPPGFRLQNTQQAVIGQHKSGALMQFDGARLKDGGMSTQRYVATVWAPKLTLRDVQTINVNGMEAVTGAARIETRGGPADLRLVAIRHDANQLYRFLFLTPAAETQKMAEEFRRTTFSFRRLSTREAQALRPLRIRIERVRPGDTVAGFARRMPFDDFREERFRVLNGLGPNDGLISGQLVKTIIEG